MKDGDELETHERIVVAILDELAHREMITYEDEGEDVAQEVVDQLLRITESILQDA